MKITLNNKVLDEIDMTYASTQIQFPLLSGTSHYRLLHYLGYQFNNSVFIDLGVCMGSSALAMAHNPTNTVHGFDISTCLGRLPNHPRITFHLGVDFMNPEFKELIISSPLVSLDIDHMGFTETAFIKYLEKEGFKGLLYMDDINYDMFPAMRTAWAKIEQKKLDVTKYGSHSGSGLVIFNPDLEIELT